MKTQIAVVGCGYWGKNLVRNFAQFGCLTHICDANETALMAQKRLYPTINTTSDFTEILRNAEISAVVIATPAACHFQHVKAAILHGKDVFVEKPLALHYHEGRELADLTEAHKVILMVGHILEYHPAVVLLRDIVRRGDLGQLRYIYSNRLNLGKVRKEENILWSFAPHDISVICSLIDAAPEVVSTSGGMYLQSNIVDVTMTNLLFKNDIRAHIFVSWLHPYKEQKLVVIGEKKMAVFDDTLREGKLKIYDKGIEWNNGLPVTRQTAETTLFFDETEPLRLECEHFLSCIEHKRQPLTGSENALRVLTILEASQLSLEREAAPVHLTEIRKGVVV